MGLVRKLWCEQAGQDIAEYAVMLAVILTMSSEPSDSSDPAPISCSPPSPVLASSP